ncbi:MAG TPA: hypothetical protein G4O18_05020 [Dehalococcoidia bacterium]|nr:hypothetical protein [Dehalococcoidia bacterium]
MSYDWGPHYIVPSSVIEAYSGIVQLREDYEEDSLRKELRELGISSPVSRVVNPWYYRKKGSPTWIKIGESEDKEGNFWVTWDTRRLSNGQYEVMGMMHVYTGTNGDTAVIARQNTVEITVRN